ncbi:MAG: toxin [Geobacteraceae bacterium GWC2_58_44]|nr:MAG: toxin [Geobacteraceae bacterium GWC2_58_44]HBG07266.1 toxin [Geobacter sp.]
MVSNESRIRFHAAFELVLDELISVVAKEKERDPENYKKSPRTKLLAKIYKAIKDDIPANPEDPSYHQGETEGYSYKQWKRAKPAEQYRLFFKCVKESNVIIYAWLNSEISLVKYRSHMDAYRAFRKSQLKKG